MPETIYQLASDARSLVPIEDRWQRADDSLAPADLPEPSLLSLEYWKTHGAALENHAGPLGLYLPNTVEVEAEGETLNEILGRCALVELSFPAFTDGRAYTQARSLRERMGFNGDIRASGDVLSDQLLYMSRCGFTSFAFADGQLPDHAHAALGEFSVSYQPVHFGPMLREAG